MRTVKSETACSSVVRAESPSDEPRSACLLVSRVYTLYRSHASIKHKLTLASLKRELSSDLVPLLHAGRRSHSGFLFCM